MLKLIIPFAKFGLLTGAVIANLNIVISLNAYAFSKYELTKISDRLILSGLVLMLLSLIFIL